MENNIKHIIFGIIFFLFAITGYTQGYQGKVFEKNELTKEGLPLIGANVFWKNTTIGVSTSNDGSFKIQSPTIYPATLMVSFVGYKTDSVIINSPIEKPINFYLKPSVVLDEAEIVGDRAATNISTISNIQTEWISDKELKKAPCCNVSESFETNASVDVIGSDAVSGAKKIILLGLDGIYAQVLFENFPIARGILSEKGISQIPGTWIESVQLTKGMGSVVNGHESLTGQINLSFLKPETTENFFLNVFGNSGGRMELNTHKNFDVSPKAKSLLFVHANTNTLKQDHNHDTFLDMPLRKTIAIFNRWNFDVKNGGFQISARANLNNQVGGNTLSAENTKSYRIESNNSAFEVFMKRGILFPNKPKTSLGTMLALSHFKDDAKFGSNIHNGKQNSIYANTILQQEISEMHSLKAGLSYEFDDRNEFVNPQEQLNLKIHGPGAFFEHVFKEDNLVMVTGLRTDYQSTGSWNFTPRWHLKYNYDPFTVLRFNIGTGFKQPTLFSSGLSVLASSRKRFFIELPQLEKAIGTGASFTKKVEIRKRPASFHVDVFHTRFINKYVADFDVHPQRIFFYNVQHNSSSTVFQVDVQWDVINRLNLKLAYKYTQTETAFFHGKLSNPMVPTNRGLITLSYETINRKWRFHLTQKFVGTSRIPTTQLNPEHYSLPEFSPSYILLDFQLNKEFRRFEIYTGVENITNFIQHDAIIAYDDPKGEYFDANMIWGPLMGRMAYLGFRFKIK